MTNGELIQKVFNCEVCEPIPEDDIIHVIFSDKNDSAIGFDWSWWNSEYKEPTTKNDLGVDAISRADALALYCDKCGVYNCISKCSGYRAVEKMPPVTPQEPRKGHWIGIDEDPHEDWECDNCGFVIWADENIEKFHYCPNCGCRMVEPQKRIEKE